MYLKLAPGRRPPPGFGFRFLGVGLAATTGGRADTNDTSNADTALNRIGAETMTFRIVHPKALF